jgi:hypothetical protein
MTEENDNVLMVALVSAILVTFLITFIFTFIFGCICGICFSKKCNKPLRMRDSTAVYEDVVPSGGRRQEQSLVLKQNVAYVSVVASSNP